MKIDHVDLAFLHLAVSKNGKFNEQDIAGSELAYLGVGRTLDRLAALKEKNLINLDGAYFSITDFARELFWGKDTPIQTRLLRLLQIKSFEESEIIRYLLEPKDIVIESIEESRKKGFFIFTTIKKDDRVFRVCELTPEGNDHVLIQTLDSKSQLQKILQEISIKIDRAELDEFKIKEILDKIKKISTELG